MAKNEYIIPSNPADQKRIQDAIKEASDSLLRISSERELLKDIAKSIKEDIGMPPRLFNKLAKTYFQQNYNEVVEEDEQFQEAYEIILGNQEPV